MLRLNGLQLVNISVPLCSFVRVRGFRLGLEKRKENFTSDKIQDALLKLRCHNLSCRRNHNHIRHTNILWWWWQSRIKWNRNSNLWWDFLATTRSRFGSISICKDNSICTNTLTSASGGAARVSIKERHKSYMQCYRPQMLGKREMFQEKLWLWRNTNTL